MSDDPLSAIRQRDQYGIGPSATQAERDRHRLLGMLDAALTLHACTACPTCEQFSHPCPAERTTP